MAGNPIILFTLNLLPDSAGADKRRLEAVSYTHLDVYKRQMAVLKHILEVKGTDNLAEVWPDLEVFFHGGVAFTPCLLYTSRCV